MPNPNFILETSFDNPETSFGDFEGLLLLQKLVLGLQKVVSFYIFGT